MCVVSMVFDHYQPVFPQPVNPIPTVDWTKTFTTTYPFVVISQEEADKLRALIKEFREALEAAKTVDKLTGQPDCEDPEKKKLEGRVSLLEKQLADIKAALTK